MQYGRCRVLKIVEHLIPMPRDGETAVRFVLILKWVETSFRAAAATPVVNTIAKPETQDSDSRRTKAYCIPNIPVSLPRETAIDDIFIDL